MVNHFGHQDADLRIDLAEEFPPAARRPVRDGLGRDNQPLTADRLR